MRSKIYTLLFILFSLHTLSIAQFTNLFDFNSDESGFTPYFAALYSDGTYLYGTTTNGGLNNRGTIFKIKPDGTDFTVIFDFDEINTGSSVESSVISDGNYLYGVASLGGEFGFGTIFKIKPDGADFTKLYDFEGGVNGYFPHGSLYYDGSFFYGMAAVGGVNGNGTIYKIKSDGTAFDKIFDFDADLTGAGPRGALISDGNFLYGMTYFGGAGNEGTLFKIKPDGTEFDNILDFIDDPNGSTPYGAVVYDGTYLYGITNGGGNHNLGTIFKILTDGSGYQKLYDFDLIHGGQPLGSLIMVDTKLYGMAEIGGMAEYGVLFQLNADGTDFQILQNFDGPESGALPFGTLVYDYGAIFGMTTSGRSNGLGGIFRWGDLAESIETISSQEMFIYPNPSNGKINIDPDALHVNGACYFELYNTLVEKVYTKEMYSAATTVDLSYFEAGIYLATLYQNGHIYNTKLIINK